MITLTRTLLFICLIAACDTEESRRDRAAPDDLQRESNGPSVGSGSSDGSDGGIRYLPPESFADMPAAIAGELTERGCTVPQAHGTGEPHNVIRGQFTGEGQDDWAVLCSTGGISTILVFWSGNPERVDEIGTAEDNAFMQTVAPGTVGFSRYISAVDQTHMLRQAQRYRPEQNIVLNHWGIDDAFVEKASVIHYYHEGAWVMLQGAD